MPSSLLKNLVFSITILAGISYSATPPPLFLERPVENALLERTSWIVRAGIDTVRYRRGELTATDIAQCGRFLASDSGASGAWFSFLSGLTYRSSENASASGELSDVLFANALQSAAEDAGTTWLLFVEFKRFGLVTWEEKALRQCEKLFLIAGAQRSELYTQQLCTYAQQAGSSDRALRYLYWARQFDSHSIAPHIALLTLPGQFTPENISTATLATITSLRSHWPFQAFVLQHLVRFTLLALGIFCLAVIMGLSFKHIDKALHGLADRFPMSVHPHVRHAYVACIFLSFVTFGFIPFAWLSIICIWPFLSRQEKTLAGILTLLLVLAPVGVRVDAAFRALTDPSRAPSLFTRAISEGSYPELDHTIQMYARANPNDYLAHVAAAVGSIKAGDIDGAQAYIGKAELLNPNDPVVMLTTGNVAYYGKNVTRASDYFGRCIKLFPEIEATFFNPCLYYFGELKILEGMSLIENAGKINPLGISSFIKKNDEYFSGNWPLMRHVLQPDYKSEYFWKNVFPRYWGSFKDADTLWGSSFLGLGIIPYWVLALLGIFAINLRSRQSTGVKTMFSCKLCGIPVCRSCKQRELCPRCFERVENIPDSLLLGKVTGDITHHRNIRSTLITGGLNAVFPGLGSLYSSRKWSPFTTPKIVLSSLAWSILIYAGNVFFLYPAKLTGSLAHFLTIPALLYCIYGLISAGMFINKGLRQRQT